MNMSAKSFSDKIKLDDLKLILLLVRSITYSNFKSAI